MFHTYILPKIRTELYVYQDRCANTWDVLTVQDGRTNVRLVHCIGPVVELSTVCFNQSERAIHNVHSEVVCGHHFYCTQRDALIIFHPHIMGEENRNLCCVFFQILPNLRDLHLYLTILVTCLLAIVTT